MPFNIQYSIVKVCNILVFKLEKFNINYKFISTI